ncbi:MAG TPA: hypothetical protein VII33_09120 [Nakamurella sp.]
MVYNLSTPSACWRAGKLAKARTATIRSKLINIDSRLSHFATVYTLHLPPAPARELPPRDPLHDHVRRRPGPTPSGLTSDRLPPQARPGTIGTPR